MLTPLPPGWPSQIFCWLPVFALNGAMLAELIKHFLTHWPIYINLSALSGSISRPHADQLDEIEVEDFPTLLIEDAHNTYFFGTVLPYAAVVERLLASLPSVNKAVVAPKLHPLLTAYLPKTVL